MGRKWDAAVERCAGRQEGLVSREQLRQLGVTRRQVERRVESGVWTRVLPGVFRCAELITSPARRFWATWLWAGADAVLSHQSAAELYSLGRWPEEAVHVSIPAWAKAPAPWIFVHQHRTLPSQERRSKSGFCVTSPARTLLDLAAVLEDDARLEEAFHEALRRRLTGPAELERLLNPLPERTRGLGRLKRLVQETSHDPLKKSELERLVSRLLKRLRFPPHVFQHRVIARGRLLGTVDFAWPEAKVIVEAEGFRFHTERTQWSGDLARYNALVLEGWLVVRLTWADVERESTDQLKQLKQTLRDRTVNIMKIRPGKRQAPFRGAPAARPVRQ